MTAGHKSFTLAADNESDMQDWLSKLQSVLLNQNKMQEDTRSASLEREKSKNIFHYGVYAEPQTIFLIFPIFLSHKQLQIQVKIKTLVHLEH